VNGLSAVQRKNGEFDMSSNTRKIIDKSFSSMGIFSIILLIAALIVLLAPIFVNGIGAFIFKGTVEFRRFNFEKLGRGNQTALDKELTSVKQYRDKVWKQINEFSQKCEAGEIPGAHEYLPHLQEIRTSLNLLFGPRQGESQPPLPRDQYGQTRWNKAKELKKRIMFVEKWDYSDPKVMGKKVLTPRINDFKGTELESFFIDFDRDLAKMMNPKWTFYWRFLFDPSFDSHFLGGIWAEVLGTIYLVIGTMLFAIPIGVISAIYLAEFASNGKLLNLLRTCISTLAGVPSIVFGLFGLAFFINTLKISDSKSVLVGSLTLAILVLPTIIRASEEAIIAVPKTYKEAALSLGASKLHTVLTVIIPSALPGILTGIVISMGRAAGETAPIIFTAAVSAGRPLKLLETFTQPTPALPWNIYNLVTEHEAVEQIRHVQFGMVFTLVVLVLLFNLTAIIMRAKISKKLRG
jgi:phosphate transport system permease protein